MLISMNRNLKMNQENLMGEEQNNHEEETEIKITDKRKFNVDGSLREGVVIENDEQLPSVEEPTVISSPEGTGAAPKEAFEATTVEPEIDAASSKAAEDNEEQAIEDDLEDIESDDPASFINFLSTLVSNAAASLGAMPHPVTGQKSVDLETGKFWIDVLTMLRAKTKGNLSDQEARVFDTILSDLQLQYVAISKAAEDQLKSQAAQQFSSKDVLGG